MVKYLSELAYEEAESACKYAKRSIESKDSNPTLAKIFYDVSLQELEHVNLFRMEAKKLLEKKIQENTDDVIECETIYNYLMELQMEKVGRTKAYQSMYKN